MKFFPPLPSCRCGQSQFYRGCGPGCAERNIRIPVHRVVPQTTPAAARVTTVTGGDFLQFFPHFLALCLLSLLPVYLSEPPKPCDLLVGWLLLCDLAGPKVSPMPRLCPFVPRQHKKAFSQTKAFPLRGCPSSTPPCPALAPGCTCSPTDAPGSPRAPQSVSKCSPRLCPLFCTPAQFGGT